MLEQAASMFDGMRQMMKKLKKASYETNMKEFRNRNQALLKEMTDYTGDSEDSKSAVNQVAEVFVQRVKEAFEKRGKIDGTTQIDLNFFMIYYVFPAILMTEHKNARLLADVLCEKWGMTFKNSKIGYTDYDTLYKSFREKIFGIF
ncbi:MAG: hypothetical protein IKM28_08970 [Lachnospiraceae bacterium]|nr:hypothetical protein [Lachnospiraceae bacterium]